MTVSPKELTKPAHDPAVSKPRRSAWSWTDINFWLDALLLVIFVVLCWSAVVVRFVFPPGPSAKGWTLWGFDYDAWAGLQFGLLGVLSVGILVHVMFHWSWVCNVIATRFFRDKKARLDDGLQTIYGVGLLIVLLNIIGLGVAAAVLMIQSPG